MRAFRSNLRERPSSVIRTSRLYSSHLCNLKMSGTVTEQQSARIATSKTLRKTDLDPPYLAKPSGLCCLKGTIHNGEPRGQFVQVAGIETYVVKPPAHKSNGNIILYYPDVWGMFTNGLLVMDSFAEAGYLTVGLDYFRGVRSSLSTSIMRKPRIFVADNCATSRILSGNIAPTDTTPLQILNSTMKLGRRSTLLLRTKLFQDGHRRSRRILETQRRDTPV